MATRTHVSAISNVLSTRKTRHTIHTLLYFRRRGRSVVLQLADITVPDLDQDALQDGAVFTPGGCHFTVQSAEDVERSTDVGACFWQGIVVLAGDGAGYDSSR